MILSLINQRFLGVRVEEIHMEEIHLGIKKTVEMQDSIHE